MVTAESNNFLEYWADYKKQWRNANSARLGDILQDNTIFSAPNYNLVFQGKLP